MLDDFSSEFDPFSPQSGRSLRSEPAGFDQGLRRQRSDPRLCRPVGSVQRPETISTWQVNPPNPTGYAPTMMVACMNDPGTGPTLDPLYNPDYSQFCYEIP